MSLKHLVIVTGLSGSGKTKALNFLEDLGYFCIDNMPTVLIKKFLELYSKGSAPFEKVALGVDIREKDLFYNLDEIFEEIKRQKIPYDLIFLEASNEVLVRRFKETRRRHPISKFPELVNNINYEREVLRPLKARATITIDTSYTNVNQLKDLLYRNLEKIKESYKIQLQFISFGYKNGLPPDSDFVFDLRYLPNPFYEENLKDKTGLEPGVKEYVLECEAANKTIELLKQFLSFVIEQLEKERRAYVVVSFGCTGGRHRSVVFAELFKEYFAEKGYLVSTMHRDIDKQ